MSQFAGSLVSETHDFTQILESCLGSGHTGTNSLVNVKNHVLKNCFGNRQGMQIQKRTFDATMRSKEDMGKAIDSSLWLHQNLEEVQGDSNKGAFEDGEIGGEGGGVVIGTIEILRVASETADLRVSPGEGQEEADTRRLQCLLYSAKFDVDVLKMHLKSMGIGRASVKQ